MKASPYKSTLLTEHSPRGALCLLSPTPTLWRQCASEGYEQDFVGTSLLSRRDLSSEKSVHNHRVGVCQSVSSLPPLDISSMGMAGVTEGASRPLFCSLPQPQQVALGK